MTTTQSRLWQIRAPQPGHNLFPQCGCTRVCLECGAGVVGQCEARLDDVVQCQRRDVHTAHFAEGRTDDGRWYRLTWVEEEETTSA